MKVKGPRFRMMYFRLDAVEAEELQKIAEAEERPVADITRRAVTLYLKGGAKEWAAVQEQLRADEPQIPQRVIQLADYLSRLDERVLVKVAEVAQGLALVYSERADSDGAIQTPAGRVKNIFLAARIPGNGTEGGNRPGRGRKKHGGT